MPDCVKCNHPIVKGEQYIDVWTCGTDDGDGIWIPMRASSYAHLECPSNTAEPVAKILAAHRCYKQFVYDGSPPFLCLCGAVFSDEKLHDLHVAEKISDRFEPR